MSDIIAVLEGGAEKVMTVIKDGEAEGQALLAKVRTVVSEVVPEVDQVEPEIAAFLNRIKAFLPAAGTAANYLDAVKFFIDSVSTIVNGTSPPAELAQIWNKFVAMLEGKTT